MNRALSPEWLDELPADARPAVDSRRDLRRLNSFLRHPRHVAASLLERFPEKPPREVVELGAGDGSFMLETARLLAWRWAWCHAILVDQRRAVDDRLLREFEKLGWTAEVVVADVFDWLERNRAEAAVANLFLHHFDQATLARLLQLLSDRTSAVVACEPRRALLPFCLTHLLGLVGCNSVTRHDAPISVRAGFRGYELTSLWPASGWRFQENEASWSSHLFVARREK